MKRYLKYICALLVLITCLSLLCACDSSRAVPAGKLALTPVGTVGDYEVLYEEYYFLAQNFLKTVKEDFDGTDDELRERVKELVYTDIITNHAILALCDQEGVEYDERDMKDAVQQAIDDMIASDFKDRDAYLESIESSHATDHYIRFVSKVDLIYELLPLQLASNGKLHATDEIVFDYVKENFVRTWHIMIANDSGDDKDENLAKANRALERLRSGEVSMYKLIGSADNEDVFMPVDGYCFAKGAMSEEYEAAAFGLEVGEYSDVVYAKGENGLGEYLDCYYVMQRLAIDDNYIKENYDDIYTAYSNAIIYEELSKVKENLEFAPNDFCNSLDILSLDKPEAGFDPLPLIIVGICAVVIGGTVTLAVILIKKKKKALRKR